MKLRSRGLGRRELVMDFREYEIARDGDDVVVSGTIREPVNWDFTIRISGDDIPGMLRVALHRHTLSVAARWMLHVRPKVLAVRASAGAAPVSPVPVPIAKASRPLRSVPLEVATVVASRPAPITRLRPPAVATAPDTAPVSAAARTPDFGAPRRRGPAPMERPGVERAAVGGGGG